HHQAADADALVLQQLVRDLWGTKPAVAFAGDELDRLLPPGLLDPFADEDSERIGVAVDRPELAPALIAGGRDAAVAGAGRVDEQEIGEVEPGRGVRLQHRRARYGGPGRREA